jgi:CO/xanthine dehydrogenase FAD-binding subunit
MDDIEYILPKDLEEVFRAIKETKGQARFIAGCTDVIPNMRAGAISPEFLIDLSGLEDLAHIREENGAVSIGALTTISEVAKSGIIRNLSPILSSAASSLGNPLIRNRATIGGNLADASPAADMAPPLLAIEAAVQTERSGGKGREISLDKFFLGPHKTVLEDDEIIIQISFSKPKDAAKGSYIKLGLRDSMAISVATIAVMLEVEGKMCHKARVALGAVAPTPIRAYRVEKNLEGRELDQRIIEECSAIVKEEISPIDDIRASAEYRRLVTSALLKRGIHEALKGGGT